MYYRLNNVLSDIKSDITSKGQSYFSAELVMFILRSKKLIWGGGLNDFDFEN
jgi:hypothetical protein